ncbi:hypothetical protein AK812_SmicGene4259 [Symbiodinium microadriaticum]|uniref:C3H1-type domain-containing protein n=1 Tax=Symbiodinium microadriaticum TaxID=2951 RepID=A0A1Q9EWP1_SYMMI|nr:hypothetical protein AK812_SmicGene4259 [Symbiodinium microadriaticum]
MASVSSSPSDAYSEGLGGFLESLAASHGSLGHPQLCQRPCVHMAKRGSCSLGSACRFCHDTHSKAPLKMEKAQREIMQAMRKEDVRTLLIPHIQKRLQQLELTEKAASLLLLFGQELYSDVQHAFKDINQRDLSKLNRFLARLPLLALVKYFPSTSPTTVDAQLDLLRSELDQQRALMQGVVIQL